MEDRDPHLIQIFKMDENYLYLFKDYFLLLIYLIAIVFAIVYYRKYLDTCLRYFPILIAYTLFNESLGHMIRYSDDFALWENYTFANDVIYNIYDLFYYGFFFYVFYVLNSDKKQQKMIKILSIIILCGYIIESFYHNPLLVSLYYATSLASFSLGFLSLMHLWYILKKHPEHVYSNLMFWISLGLIIFHFLFPPLFLTGYLAPQIWYSYNINFIIRIIIIIMYSFFCIGFFRSRRRSFR